MILGFSHRVLGPSVNKRRRQGPGVLHGLLVTRSLLSLQVHSLQYPSWGSPPSWANPRGLRPGSRGCHLAALGPSHQETDGGSLCWLG